MHVIDQLLKEGQPVRGTIRSLNDKEKVDGLKKLDPIELVEANLDDVDSWKRAVKGVDIVIHIATPATDSFVFGEQETIRKAVDGKKKNRINSYKLNISFKYNFLTFNRHFKCIECCFGRRYQASCDDQLMYNSLR